MAAETLAAWAAGGCFFRLVASAGFLALGLRRLAIGFVLGQQELAEHLQVAAQNAQTDVTLEAPFALVTAMLLTVAALQGVDR